MAETSKDTSTNASAPAAAPRKPRLVTRIAEEIPVVVILWLAACPFAVSWSERFYLMVPWLFLVNTLLRVAHLGFPETRRRLLLLAAGICFVVAIFALDLWRPSTEFRQFERTLGAYGLMSLTIACSWFYTLLSWPIRKTLRITSDSSTLWRIIGRLLSLALFSIFLNAYVLSFLQTHWPKLSSDWTPAQYRMDYEDVTWRSSDGLQIGGWFVPSSGSTRTAVVCHGVGAHRGDMREFIKTLHDGGFNVLAFDFRGHGTSRSHTVTYGAMEKEDIISGIDMLKHRHPVKANRIVGVGWSMGAASLILAAAEDERIEALHIDAAYARVFDVAAVITKHYPPVYRQTGHYLGTLLACLETGTNLFHLAPVAKIAKITPRPIMMVHGTNDGTIPIEQGRLLFSAAGEPKQWHEVSEAGHCQTFATEGQEYAQRLLHFLRQATKD